MTTTQHTPGPWTYDGAALGTKIGKYHYRTICEESWGSDIPYQEMEANERLRAAAPDLLAALKSVMEWVDILKVNLRNSVKEEIKAAIAKAEGKA